MILAVLSFGLLTYQRSRRGSFFLIYIFLALLPVVFFTNHRFAHYWYIPFLGLSGLAALAAGRIIDWAQGEMSPKLAAIAGMALIAYVCQQQYFQLSASTHFERMAARDVSREYMGFVAGLRALGPLEQNATLYFESIPTDFDQDATRVTVGLVLNRNDLEVELVSECSPEAKYCLGFERSQLRLEMRGAPQLGETK